MTLLHRFGRALRAAWRAFMLEMRGAPLVRIQAAAPETAQILTGEIEVPASGPYLVWWDERGIANVPRLQTVGQWKIEMSKRMKQPGTRGVAYIDGVERKRWQCGL
jgi:hypothetical protein